MAAFSVFGEVCSVISVHFGTVQTKICQVDAVGHIDLQKVYVVCTYFSHVSDQIEEIVQVGLFGFVEIASDLQVNFKRS